jgi:hypothetical protein
MSLSLIDFMQKSRSFKESILDAGIYAAQQYHEKSLKSLIKQSEINNFGLTLDQVWTETVHLSSQDEPYGLFRCITLDPPVRQLPTNAMGGVSYRAFQITFRT